ncbi:MAG: extracellular solute-binding protein [Treponema sp.]|jgi:raffinose/stachyose/melibiose transport system substrate-binding protein|nr:extracellular solute-binding protein [Treponema sp.]
MKKFSLIMAILLLMATAVFAGGTKQSGATLTLWHQSVGETDPSAKILKQLIAQWNREHPDIKVTEDGVTGEQYKTKINTALAANDAPDIFYMWGGSFSRPFIEAGKMLDITDMIPGSTKNTMIPGAVEAVTVNGRIYSFPCYTHIANLYCNKELFEKAGAKLPATYAELLDTVKKLRAAGITPAVLGEKDRWPGMYWFDIMAMRQAGNPASMAAMRDPAKFNSPDFIEAARKVQELVDAGLFNTSLFSMSYDEMLGAFNNGQAAMMFQANWINAGIEDISSTIRGKVTVIPFPVFEDGKGKAGEFFGGGIDSYYIYSGTKYPKEAVQFLAWFSENLGKQGYLAGAGLPCWKIEGLDTSGITGLDREVAALMGTAESFIPWWDNVLPADASEIHKNLIADLLAKNITPQQFAQEMSKVVKSDL